MYLAAPNFNGVDQFSVVASDGALSSEVTTVSIVVNSINDMPTLAILSPAGGSTYTEGELIVFEASAEDEEDGNLSEFINWSSDISGFISHGARIEGALVPGVHNISAAVSDSEGGETFESITVTVNKTSGGNQELPDDPSEVATPLNESVVTTFKSSTEFLYLGDNPIQTDAVAEAFEAERVSVIRGKILDRDSNPLPGVIITIKDHPEFGQTLSREDGMFDIAVNGGGSEVINYTKDGFLPIQRIVHTSWGDFSQADEIVMIELDQSVSSIDLASGQAIQVAQSSVQTDMDGSRQATLFFSQGTSASMALPDGSKQPLSTINVRATEYTVGVNGPEAMPGTLPSTSGYTYAVELSVDEAIAAEAKRIDFSKPIPVYVDNFLNFPVGEIVPSGWYDSETASWKASNNGLIIGIANIVDGVAEIDVDGDGSADDQAQLDEVGITLAEATQLASLYQAGKTLWRVPVSHFTPWDFNWPYGPPDDSEVPEIPPEVDDMEDPEDQEECPGCIILAQSQVLGEDVPVVGTSFSLNYRSDRVPGYQSSRSIKVPLSGDNIPASLKEIELQIDVAGQRYLERFDAGTNLIKEYEWDGKDAYGRFVATAEAVVSVSYVYDQVYYSADDQFINSFASLGAANQAGGLTSIGRRENAEVAISRQWKKRLGTFVPSKKDFGGWQISAHHFYDPIAGVFYGGDGDKRSAASLSSDNIYTIAGNGVAGYQSGQEGGSAKDAYLNYPADMAVASDGTVYIADTDNSIIRRVNRDGSIETVAGIAKQAGYSGDNVQAVQAELNYPSAVAPDNKGGFYIADDQNYRIRYVDSEGIITTVAGNGVSSDSGDGGLAINASLSLNLSDIALGSDGGFYVSTRWGVRRVDSEGIISTVAGNRNITVEEEEVLATQSSVRPWSIATGKDGELYVGTTSHRVRHIDSSGIIRTIAGTGVRGYNGDGLPGLEAQFNTIFDIAVSAEGDIYLADEGNLRIRKIDKKGLVTTVVGNGEWGGNIDGTPAADAMLQWPDSVSIGANGELYVASTYGHQIFKVGGPALALPEATIGDIAVASRDGKLLYVFNKNGRHEYTVDTFTNAIVHSFSYDADGLLESIIGRNGDETVIERDYAGQPLVIVSADGLRTRLNIDSNGYLSGIVNPNEEGVQIQYLDDGLMSVYTDARNNSNAFEYDNLGRLLSDRDPIGGGWQLSRNDQENKSIVTMTSAEGRVSTYSTEMLENGDRLQLNTARDGSQSTVLHSASGVEEFTVSGTGMEFYSKENPDPRFGMLAPVNDLTITTPRGLANTIQTVRQVELRDQDNILSHSLVKDTVTRNGNAWVQEFDYDSLTSISTTPEGRQVITEFNDLGYKVKEQVAGLAAVYFEYDDRWRLTALTQGEDDDQRSVQYHYGDDGFLLSVQNALQQTTQFERDKAGRITRKVLPDSRAANLTFDGSGNLKSLVTPSAQEHLFNYTERDLEDQYSPPEVIGMAESSTGYTYNLDKQLKLISRPDGGVLDYVYDDLTGQLTSVVISRGVFLYGYNENSGQLRSIDSPDGIGIEFQYDGYLLTDVTWQGVVAGDVSVQYNNDFQVTERSVNGGRTISFEYDNDALLVQAGALAISRNPTNGLVMGTSLENVDAAYIYNTFGEVGSYKVSNGREEFYSVDYKRDGLGRIVEKNETVGGELHQYIYVYDVVGRLNSVRVNGSLTQYDYDNNGNLNTLNGQVIASFDEQDRLMNFKDISYDYNDNGELIQKINTSTAEVTTYRYDALGNLISVVLPDSSEIEYLVDGKNRRVGKKVNGDMQWGLLYKDQLNPIAELDSKGTIVSRFIYGHKMNVPAYIEKAGITYRIFSDHLGSPRLIVDVATGDVVQRMDYDVWGNVTLDTNPGFQPFGFAGGVYDQNTKLTRFGARDYDAQVGRWTAKDPIRFDGGDTNIYGYVGQDPVNYFDIWGLDTIGVSLNGSAGFGAGGTVGVNVVVDNHGNIAVQVTGGVGGDTPGASVTVNAEGTNAETVHDLTGTGAQTGVDGGEGVVVEGGSMFGEGYSGWYGGYGIGAGTPIGASGYLTGTKNVIVVNPFEAFNKFREWLESRINNAQCN